MKTQLLFWSMLMCIFAFGNAQGVDATGNIIFPDANFKNALLAHTNPVVDTSGDGKISIEEAEVVTKLNVSDKEITDLNGIEYFTNLNSLLCYKNQLTNLDVTQNTSLITLSCNRNQLASLNITKNLSLVKIICNQNQLTELDVTQNLSLEELNCSQNPLTSLDVTKNIFLSSLKCVGNNLTSLDVTKNTVIKNLSVVRNPLISLDVTQNINLTRLTCYPIATLDVTQNINLEFLSILNSPLLTNIDVSKNVKLKRLDIFQNRSLASLDVTKNTELIDLNCFTNRLTSLDVTQNVKLKTLDCYQQQITDLDLTQNTELTSLRCFRNQLTSLDVRSCMLTELDFRSNSNLQTVFMTDQPLEYETNIFDEEILQVGLSNCPSLQFICADQEYLNDIYSLLEDAEQTDVQLSNNCDDPHNRIQGNITYDVDNDGCGDADDVPFTGGLRYSAISLSTGDSYVTYPNDQGQYTLHIADDIYFLGPALENFEYFGFSEPILQAPTVIPLQLPNLTTDYCIQPLGIFNDLEIAIYPTGIARPGFTASYIIKYKNRGTTTQSGTITLDYEDDVLEYVSSTPGVTSNSNGQLIWEFTDLLPSAIVELPLTLRLNTPTDSPALNGGDILDFVATITGATDETPEDNVMELAQLVVNSYDPNNKTCLEGDVLDPDDVGGYLHYLIRFENEGTANAINIRVTDVIDTTKFDIESFEPISSSHSVLTTITNGSEIEFAFNNINLPFDDANNDGYVIFKIKTLDTLTEGDEIVNSAAIYFDYNFPILTEDSVVEVKREVVSEPGFSDYFTLSPNPTTGIMDLTVLDDSIAISYMLIYDMGGNLVGYYLGTTRTMNVSYLFPNSYIMKIVTDKGELSTQFIKL